MQTIYNVDQSIKDRLTIDTNLILGKRVATFDEYCLYFPQSRQLAYKHLKHSSERVKLSYLHKRYYEELGSFWVNHREEINENTTTYAKVVNANVRDDHSWKTYGAWLAAVYFDKTKLQYKRVADAASKVFHECYLSSYKHWSVFSTRLHSTRDNSANTYHVERMNMIRDMFENVILRNVKRDTDLRISYTYDRVECTTHDKYTIRMNIGYLDLTKTLINIDVLHNLGAVSIPSKKALILAKVSSRYAAIGQIIQNIESNASVIMQYLSDVRDLLNKHEYYGRQNHFVLRTLLHEMRDKPDTSSFTKRKLDFVMLNPNSIQVLSAKYNKLKCLQYRKTTYIYDSHGQLTECIKSHLQTQYKETDIDRLAEHLLHSGFVNIHDADIPIDDYEQYINGSSENIGHIVYKTTYTELAATLHMYFRTYHTHLIDTYDSEGLDIVFNPSEEFGTLPYMNYFDFKKFADDSERFYQFHEYQTSERVAYLRATCNTYASKYKTLSFMTEQFNLNDERQ